VLEISVLMIACLLSTHFVQQAWTFKKFLTAASLTLAKYTLSSIVTYRKNTVLGKIAFFTFPHR
jgi:hypothetical protein